MSAAPIIQNTWEPEHEGLIRHRQQEVSAKKLKSTGTTFAVHGLPRLSDALAHTVRSLSRDLQPLRPSSVFHLAWWVDLSVVATAASEDTAAPGQKRRRNNMTAALMLVAGVVVAVLRPAAAATCSGTCSGVGGSAGGRGVHGCPCCTFCGTGGGGDGC